MQESEVRENLAREPEAQNHARVLIVISTHIVGGPAKGLLQLVPELERRGAKPILCTFRKRGEAESPFIAACRARGLGVVPLWQRFHLDPAPVVQLVRFVREHGINVIQTHGYKENAFGLLVRLATRRRWICFLHGTTDENLKIRLYQALNHRIVRLADRIVSVSHELAARSLPAAALQKVRIVPNAIAQPVHPGALAVARWRRRTGAAAENVIACIGRLSPEKGHAVLLKAARILADTGAKFQLLLVGDGPEREVLERQCETLGLWSRVRFLGHRSDTELVYAAADMLVLPSFQEGMPNVILEAMAHGLPIVATRAGAVPEMLRDGEDAVLVPTGDAAALAGAIGGLLREPQRAAALGKAAHKALFPRYSVERRVEQIEGVYRELLGEE